MLILEPMYILICVCFYLLQSSYIICMFNLAQIETRVVLLLLFINGLLLNGDQMGILWRYRSNKDIKEKNVKASSSFFRQWSNGKEMFRPSRTGTIIASVPRPHWTLHYKTVHSIQNCKLTFIYTNMDHNSSQPTTKRTLLQFFRNNLSETFKPFKNFSYVRVITDLFTHIHSLFLYPFSLYILFLIQS